MHRPGLHIALTLALGAAVLTAPAVSAFVNNNRSWPSSTIVMHLQLGTPSNTLINGCPNWGCAAQRAMNDWNLYLNRSQFLAIPDSTAPIEDGNRVNNMFYNRSIFGDPFDSSTLAITLQTF